MLFLNKKLKEYHIVQQSLKWYLETDTKKMND